MVSNSIPATVGTVLVAPLFPFLAIAGEGEWLQLGLGGAALLLALLLLKPLVRSQTHANDRMARSVEESAKSIAASTEIQRVLLTHAQDAARTHALLAAAVDDLAAKVESLRPIACPGRK